MKRRWLALVLLLLCHATTTTVRATQEQIAAAETRRLLADRAWFSQIARVQQPTDPVGGRGRVGATVQDASGSCSPDGAGACLVVTELLQPGVTVEGYELVERAALLGVCDQQSRGGNGNGNSGFPAAQIADKQQQQARGSQGGNEVIAVDNEEALELIPAVQYAAKQAASDDSGDNAEERDEERDGENEEQGSVNPVCALPIALQSGDTGTQVAQTAAAARETLVDGPTLEYQVRMID